MDIFTIFDFYIKLNMNKKHLLEEYIMVSIKDIAQKSGYSTTTISRLFNGDETLNITNITKKKIIDVALEMGYDRSKIKTTYEKIVVLFYVSESQMLKDIYFKQVKTSLEKYAKLANMELFFITSPDKFYTFPDDASGFIAVGSIPSEQLFKLKDKDFKGVVLEYNPTPNCFDTVKPDTDNITKEAINYFINEGFTKIGFIGGKKYNIDTAHEELDSREIIFRSYLSTKKLFNESYIFSGESFSVEGGYNLAKKMVTQLDKELPQACLIASDAIAVGFLQYLYEKNIAVPEDIAIISINDDEIAQFVAPPLTTYHIDTEEIAKTAISLLNDQIIHPRNITKTVLIGAELIIRKSFIPTKTL